MGNRHNKENVEEHEVVKCDYANMLVTKNIYEACVDNRDLGL